MTEVLNFFSHIGNYAGAGMIMLVIGIILIIAASVRLSRLRKADRRRAAAEFNQQFVADTGASVSDVEAGARRREIARELGIGERRQ